MPKLSVVIITLNEEKYIQQCIESVYDIADEIIIVDSFSTDKTEEISIRYDKVYFFKNRFDGYIEQRNLAVSKANNPYILAIDADEVLSGELQTSIAQVKKEWTHDYYGFNRYNNFCGKWIKHSGWYPDMKLRLFNSRKGKFGGVNPHDKLIMKSGSTYKFLNGDLLHFPYRTITEHITQQNKFSDIKASALFEKGKKYYLLKIFFGPIVNFFKTYLLKLGFLDGFYGFVICMNGAYYTFLTYVKLHDLYKHKRKIRN